MKRRSLIIIIVLIILGVGGVVAVKWFKTKPVVIENSASYLTLTLPEVEGDDLPALYTCDGEDINPALEWSGVPAGAKSLVLTVTDVSVKNSPFTHWLVWTIAPKDGSVRAGNLPIGANTGTGSSGRVGYVGPCPKGEEHNYVFKISALDTILDLPVSTTLSELEIAILGHVLQTDEVTVNYE